MRRTFSILILATTLVSQPLSAAYSALYGFGDSLSDSGNIAAIFPFPATPPYSAANLIPNAAYPSGRLSNGPVWIEQFATKLGLSATPSFLGGSNYSQAGARTGPAGSFFPDSVIDQVGSFYNDTGGSADPDALYSVWAGGNDLRDAIGMAAAGNTAAANATIATAVGDISGIVATLATMGATDFIVPNLPDLGLIPEITRLNNPVASAAATAASVAFNNGLALAIANLRGGLGLNIIELDVMGLFDALIANPGGTGLTNLTDPCILENNGFTCSNPDSFLFWDGIHPTSAAHGLIADQAFRQVVPVPAAGWLMMSGLAVLWVRRQRRPLP